jgi:single-stranded-DNA-specific exonuclease
MGLTKRWSIKEVDAQIVNELQASLRVHPAICKMLVARGIHTFDQAKLFFRPQLSDLHDPFLMKGMQKAVDRICSAIEWNERILIYGDYDVDGTSSVAVVYSFLKSLYAGQLNYYIPHRYKEGYGLSKQGIDFAKANGHTLLITLDCGIKSADLVDYANGLGIDVIICDHHLPDERIPNALAILNPKQADCTYPYKELSACGIGFKLIEALAIQLNKPKESVYAYLDLVATSIAADIVALDGENRVLGFYGIKKANEQPSLSLKTLLEASDFKRTLQMSDLVFVIGPRVNAAGRMDDAKKAVELFIETDEEKVKEIAAALQADNLDRKEVDKTITEQAIQLLQHPHQQHKKSTVLFQTNWHKGVVGIVASRLIDHYYRPTIVLTESNGMASGSARSIPGFNIHEAIEACSHLLENYGGHYFAAGMTMQLHQVDAFIAAFEKQVADTIDPAILIPEISIDAELQLSDITPALLNLINQFEPFGPNNLRPVFISKGVQDDKGYSRIVKDAHLKFSIQQNGARMEGIGFNLADKIGIVKEGLFDVVYTIDQNDFNGKSRLQIKVLDLKSSK